jgi:Antitoxin VbhA
MMIAPALRRPTTDTTVSTEASRPDRSEAAVAPRRLSRANALADSALEDSYPDPATADIYDSWVNGEISSAERIARLNECYRLKKLSATRG